MNKPRILIVGAEIGVNSAHSQKRIHRLPRAAYGFKPAWVYSTAAMLL